MNPPLITISQPVKDSINKIVSNLSISWVFFDNDILILCQVKQPRHFDSLTAYFLFFQIARHFKFDPRKSAVTEKYTQGRLRYITHSCVKTNKKLKLYFINNEKQHFLCLIVHFFQFSILWNIFSLYKSTAATNSAPRKCKLVRITRASISGSVAEWYKALV